VRVRREVCVNEIAAPENATRTRRTKLRTTITTFGLLAAAASIAMLAVARTPSVAAKAPISFTAGQASMGEATYYAKCAMCHGAKLEGISGPALMGKDGNLQGQTVSAVYAYMVGMMPVGNAGGLPTSDYVNIMAFLLSSNGRHASSSKLSVTTIKADTSKIGGKIQ
jgi:polar amino acid transport system substrate-binding protein